jgi:predicted DNA-binding ribbon-helix-helix protein
MTLSDLVASIDTDRRHGNLSSAIRLFVLDHYRMHNAEERIGQSDPREMQTPHVIHSVLRAD